MVNTVLIQAAGEPNKGWWHMDVRKQMVLIGKEPLIVRTQRQCTELGYQPFVVSNHSEILAVAERPFVPEQHEYYFESFLSTRELWKGQTFFLLGDAVWSDQSLAFTFGQRGSPLFIHAWGGIHAWTFHEEQADMFVGLVTVLLEEGKRVFTDLYDRLGAHVKSPMVKHCPEDNRFTRDFDYDTDYEEWTKIHGSKLEVAH